MKSLVLLVVLLLLAPAAARAQTVTPTPTPTPAATAAPDEDADDPVDDEAPIDDDSPSDEACDSTGTDSDYDYCQYSAGAGTPVTAPTPKEDGPVEERAVVSTRSPQALPATTLPYTGASPLPVALLGLAFVLVGTGGRLMIASRR